MSRMSSLMILFACLLLAGSLVSAEDKAPADEKKVVDIPIANDTGEDILFFVNGKQGSTKGLLLKKDGVIEISFYDDKNERSLAAFDKEGKEVLSLFKFKPGNFCLLIEKNQTKGKTAVPGSKKPTQIYGGGGEGPKPI